MESSYHHAERKQALLRPPWQTSNVKPPLQKNPPTVHTAGGFLSGLVQMGVCPPITKASALVFTLRAAQSSPPCAARFFTAGFSPLFTRPKAVEKLDFEFWILDFEFLILNISRLLEIDGYFTLKTLKRFYKDNLWKFNETVFCHQIPMIMERLGLERLSTNNKIKEQYGITDKGYPRIFVKKGD